VLQALALRPVMFGINWYSSFDIPDPQTGVVQLANDAVVRGGHEIMGDEIRVEDQLIGCWNSWGSSWGIGGKFYIPFAVMEQLLAQQGDCTVPVK
jgi:hypothetical protein